MVRESVKEGGSNGRQRRGRCEGKQTWGQQPGLGEKEGLASAGEGGTRRVTELTAKLLLDGDGDGGGGDRLQARRVRQPAARNKNGREIG